MDNLPVIVIRFALYADLMVLAGMVAFSVYALTARERNSGILPLATPSLIRVCGLRFGYACAHRFDDRLEHLVS